MEDFMDCTAHVLIEFGNKRYEVKVEDKKVIMSRREGAGKRQIDITKEIEIKDRRIDVLYRVENKGSARIETLFGTEFNLTMPYLNSERYNYFTESALGDLNTKGSVNNTPVFSIKDYQKEINLDFIFSVKPDTIWYFPVKTISQSERSYETNFQCSCIFPHWRIRLGKGEKFSFGIKWAIS
jgi:hypothetical protein